MVVNFLRNIVITRNMRTLNYSNIISNNDLFILNTLFLKIVLKKIVFNLPARTLLRKKCRSSRAQALPTARTVTSQLKSCRCCPK